MKTRALKTGHGWSPAIGETRQKDFSGAAARAQRMRREPTSSEVRLWKLLREENRLGANFRRQVPVEGFVYDFGDYSARLLIELDGGVHSLQSAMLNDLKKDRLAEQNGFHLLRFKNNDIWSRPHWVRAQVRALHDAPHPLPPPRKGEGI
jgi:very-short-patch-repair endonuclease